MYSIVCFSDDPVTFWTGTAWRKGAANALKIASKSDGIAVWRSLAVDKCRDVWLVKDWGAISEETIATSEDGLF